MDQDSIAVYQINRLESSTYIFLFECVSAFPAMHKKEDLSWLLLVTLHAQCMIYHRLEIRFKKLFAAAVSKFDYSWLTLFMISSDLIYCFTSFRKNFNSLVVRILLFHFIDRFIVHLIFTTASRPLDQLTE